MNKSFFRIKGGKKQKNTKKRKRKSNKKKRYSKKRLIKGKSSKMYSLKNTLLKSVNIYSRFNDALESGDYQEFKKLALSLPRNISLDDIYLQDEYGIKTFLYDMNRPFNDRYNRSLIFLAVENNDITLLEILLNSLFKRTIHEYAYYYKVDDDIGAGLDPLILASHMGNVKAVELLLDHLIPYYLESSITQNLSQDLEMRAKKITPLIAAVNGNHIEIVEMLLNKGVDINKPGLSGYTALHDAVNKNNIEMVKLLIRKGADLNVETYIIPQKPIDIAYERGYQDIYELLQNA